MRKLTLLGAIAVASALTGVEAGAAERRAGLRLVDGAPLTLRGAAFKPGERVRVTLSIQPRRWERRVRAGRAGGFTVVFQQARVGDPCTTDFHATAVGGQGSIARLKRPGRLCPMPLRGPSP
jgi:hypothetical protein